ncbi:hypothetical protein AURDEDRAFT_56899 [Auricularia subglabra TFB-10046 SS5]|nr:hypothetical protein AURDEDRAFT_56899 [Auricularia subglabra TFB-10046 SS5]
MQATFKHSTIKVEGFDDEYDLFACDPLDVVRELVGDPTYANDIEFGPGRCFEDEEGQRRIYNEMFSGDFTWEMQKRLPIGAAQIPIIIGSDKTQLTSFSGEHSAYPVYMSIGNIAKHIRGQPTKRAFRLVAYLPTLKPDETMMSEARARVLRNRLFHKAMEMVFEPLFTAAANGVSIADSQGNLRLCFPILASYVADYPEQCLVTGVRYGQTCPKCHITVDEFGAHKLGEPRVQQQSYDIVDDARAAPTAAAEKERLKDAGLNNIKPFYARWPHADMHRAQSPDCLHQVIQVVGAHLIDWLTAIMGADELDARLARLPPAHNLRNFARGISGLSRVSGSERKAIYAQLLGGIVGRAPREAVKATRALIDVIYIIQFKCHSTETLESLKTALDEFHKHKHIFQQYKPGLDFNFPKMHMLEHYAPDIRSIGTTDNTNTEITERKHIKLAKNAFRATNRADYIVQMCRWLQRRHAIHFFAVYLAWRQGMKYDARKRPPKTLQHNPVVLAKVAPCPRKQVAALEAEHGFTGLKVALKAFLQKWHGVSYRFYEGQLPDSVTTSLTLLQEVAVWYCVKFYTPNMQTFDAPEYHDIARCTPQRTTTAFRGRIVRRFDTVMVETRGNGVSGQGLADIRIGRLRAVFRIPGFLERAMFGDNPPAHLALVEWFSRPTQRDADSALYKVSRSFTREKEVEMGIIEVIDIRRSCHLFPRYGPEPVDRRLTSNTVLDAFNDFLLNDAVDKHAYDTIY